MLSLVIVHAFFPLPVVLRELCLHILFMLSEDGISSCLHGQIVLSMVRYLDMSVKLWQEGICIMEITNCCSKLMHTKQHGTMKLSRLSFIRGLDFLYVLRQPYIPLGYTGKQGRTRGVKGRPNLTDLQIVKLCALFHILHYFILASYFKFHTW